eukprot:Plantae.Rhodophyta-Purpureofilum_apyrenoidigerum.ctg15970.p1 GENE.Plantae.Rhodophyta-Purpureofilum_apyrenoidigerum.ctg15970~~Plantae.Rhodophyta-Purpureofilum_apyrenoidigerum.ctg15970.p1  ORF type:complete len:217 (-),score=33.60 Plantae.Rhodophyta-Purpureofilum_apyrenoidigerum.ctg15970:469-1119(-)
MYMGGGMKEKQEGELSHRPLLLSDYKHPERCVERKVGDLRRTWTFLGLNGEDGKRMRRNDACLSLTETHVEMRRSGSGELEAAMLERGLSPKVTKLGRLRHWLYIRERDLAGGVFIEGQMELEGTFLLKEADGKVTRGCLYRVEDSGVRNIEDSHGQDVVSAGDQAFVVRAFVYVNLGDMIANLDGDLMLEQLPSHMRLGKCFPKALSAPCLQHAY